MSLRSTFDSDAELYDRARPGYPALLFDDLAELGGLEPGARILEIGCGTGQATGSLAERGYAVTCVELGANLATVARRRLAEFSNVEVIHADVETWTPAATFDAVVAFTSFHWLAPETRYRTAASFLHPRGVLGVVSTHHVLPADGDAFFIDAEDDYRAVLPEDTASNGGPPIRPESVITPQPGAPFAPIAARRYLTDVVYTADEYIDVLSTYSGHIAQPQEQRDELFRRLHSRIAQRPSGTVRKTYLWVLDLARLR